MKRDLPTSQNLREDSVVFFPSAPVLPEGQHRRCISLAGSSASAAPPSLLA